MQILNKLLKSRIFRYLLLAPIGAASDLLVFLILTSPLHFHWLSASIISSLFSTLVGYYFSIKFVFKSGTRFKRYQEIIGVLIISFIAFILHQGLMFIFIEFLGLHLIVSKIIVIGLMFLFNYFSRSKIIFSNFRN